MKRLALHGDVVASSAPHIRKCSSPEDEAQLAGQPLDTIGIDLHKREGQLCIIATRVRRVKTDKRDARTLAESTVSFSVS